LWQILGHEDSIARVSFPVVTDESLLEEDEVTCIVQIQGKVRERLSVSPSISAEELQEAALSTDAVKEALGGREPMRVIVKAPKLVNVVLPKK
ncbi:leucine--tRNA ligase, partial [Aerococcus urinae]|nr:leucine--tRNA ligase [Aerococcus urinae]